MRIRNEYQEIGILNRTSISRRRPRRFSPNGIGGGGGGRIISATSFSAQTHSSKDEGKMEASFYLAPKKTGLDSATAHSDIFWVQHPFDLQELSNVRSLPWFV